MSIPTGYGANVRAGVPTRLQLIADGSDSNSTTVALGYATTVIGAYAQEIVEARMARNPPTALVAAPVDALRREDVERFEVTRDPPE